MGEISTEKDYAPVASIDSKSAGNNYVTTHDRIGRRLVVVVRQQQTSQRAHERNASTRKSTVMCNRSERCLLSLMVNS